jgi:hypothetical protein
VTDPVEPQSSVPNGAAEEESTAELPPTQAFSFIADLPPAQADDAVTAGASSNSAAFPLDDAAASVAGAASPAEFPLGAPVSDDTVVDDDPNEPVAHQRRRRWPGLWSFGVAAGMVVTTVAAIAFAAAGEAVTALTLTVSALGLSGIAVVLGLVSIIGKFARPWGVAGLVIGVVVNPVALLYGLSSLGLF